MPPDTSVRRVLIYRLGSLGDTIVALPVLHLVARSYPQADRRMLTNFPVHAKAPASAAVLGDSGLVGSYIRYSSGTRNPLELLRVVREVRRFKPEVLVYLIGVRGKNSYLRDKLFFRLLCGVKCIVGLPGESELTRVKNPASGLFEAEASRLARAMRELGYAEPGDLANWDLRLTPAERQNAAVALGELADKPLIVCGPGTKMQAKDWGRENWRALLGRLSPLYTEYPLVLIGAREDAEVADYAASTWAGPKLNLCGRLTPRETAAVTERAQVFLGPDSGPMHLAAAAGVPCVIAFSARGLPGVWYPVGDHHQILYRQTSCFGCNLETCIVEKRRCLSSISVADMQSAVTSVLTPRSIGEAQHMPSHQLATAQETRLA